MSISMGDINDEKQPLQTQSASNNTSASSHEQLVKPSKLFEIKKWNAVALWSWDLVVDSCAICRNHIMLVSRLL